MDANGSGIERVDFSLHRDETDPSRSRNVAARLAHPSLGAPGCTSGDVGCGPDNEDVRGELFSGVVSGTSWVVLGAGRSAGDLRYVYLSPDPGQTLAARYVDLSASLSGTKRRASST